jgi:hypothetical protein
VDGAFFDRTAFAPASFFRSCAAIAHAGDKARKEGTAICVHDFDGMVQEKTGEGGKSRGYSDADLRRLPIAEAIDGMTRWVAPYPP